MDKETAKSEVKKLIQKYETVKTDGKINDYKEEMTKKDFILPLFRTLGWDIENSNEVSAEDKISNGRVDYSFILSGIVKFFVEAKPLKADLNNPEYSKQAINYSWHKGVQWAILTDFEGLKLYNAEWREDADKAKVLDLTYMDYITDFDSLWLLSKTSIETGTLDRWSEKFGKKIKKQPVSKQILDDLLKAREKLTKNILKYPRLNKISETELDESVQRILDRLIFIRTCEDRNIEQNHLLSLVRSCQESKRDLNSSLQKNFREFDDGYNSKLFEPHLCEKLKIDNDILEEIILSLYQTKDGNIHYDFGVINADVLGSIYEQYLGHILKKTPTTAKLKETHQHRKEQGIYYTPTYIVDYIVKNTVGEVLKTAKPKEVQNLKILEPACGSGSFLIKAFDELVKYWTGELGGVRKPEILQNNIYGVDLDKQAVEITQMNLLLKTLYTRERLPMLKNIRCGNSLIDDPTVAGNKAFNWSEEFPEVLCHCEGRSPVAISSDQPNVIARRSRGNLGVETGRAKESNGGFDIIIGNPPYVFARGESFSEKEKKYYYENYDLVKYQINTYLLFVNKAYELLDRNGYFGFIIPNNWLTIDTFSEFRKFLLQETSNLKIINIFDKVFQDANIDTCLLVFQKGKPTDITLGEFRDGKLEIVGKFAPSLFKGNNYIINIVLTKNKDKITILGKIKNHSKSLDSFSIIKAGLKAYETGKGKPKQTDTMKNNRVYHSKTKEDADYGKYLEGKNVKRYGIDWSGWWLKYGECLAAPRDEKLFTNPRILVRQIPSPPPYSIYAVFTKDYLLNDINSMIIYNFHDIEPFFVLAVLNSKITTFWFVNTFDKLQRNIFPQFKVKELAIFPIPQASESEQEKIAQFSQRMLELNKQLQKFGDKITDERKRIESEIQKTDNQIDELVYKLYGLTEKEIKIVESK
ncbi:MAG: N-6 DNA methylase [Elusimicrobiota bacterium]